MNARLEASAAKLREAVDSFGDETHPTVITARRALAHMDGVAAALRRGGSSDGRPEALRRVVV